MIKKITFLMLNMLLLVIVACSDTAENPDPEEELINGLYFPETGSGDWNTYTLPELGWNTTAEQELYDLLEEKDTKAFIILKDGKIVIERYFNTTITSDLLPWFSAGKTLAATLTGIAQEEGYLNIEDVTADYLGNGWTSMTPEQEEAITIKHQLTMSTGLDYTLDTNCTDFDCLFYLNDPGTFWYYHNAPYTLISDVVTAAVGRSFPEYFSEKIGNVIGMSGSWQQVGYNRIYFSTARSMARFGLLMLNEGYWGNTAVLSDTAYFEEMTSTSQEINEAYGYLWWLNGKTSYHKPGSVLEFPGTLIPSAPADLIAGMGANDQKLYVVPGRNLVIVRMGSDAGEAQLGLSSFDEMLWQRINAVIGE